MLNSRVSVGTAYLRSTSIVTGSTEHDDVIKSLLGWAPLLGLALSPASARAGPAHRSFSGYLKRPASN